MKVLRAAEVFFWAAAAVLLGWYGYVYFERTAWQAREERAFAAAPAASSDVIGRIEIPRAGVRAMIVRGTTDAALRRAVGHIEGTALPGESGNAGLAGHRDTFFRGLRNVRKNDTILVRTPSGTYEYRVTSLSIVNPDDVEVLQASADPTLTLVTCYPFRYVGHAPRRYVVQAREVTPSSERPERAPQAAGLPRKLPRDF